MSGCIFQASFFSWCVVNMTFDLCFSSTTTGYVCAGVQAAFGILALRDLRRALR